MLRRETQRRPQKGRDNSFASTTFTHASSGPRRRTSPCDPPSSPQTPPHPALLLNSDLNLATSSRPPFLMDYLRQKHAEGGGVPQKQQIEGALKVSVVGCVTEPPLVLLVVNISFQKQRTPELRMSSTFVICFSSPGSTRNWS
ncbi:hypothetical protein L798_05784 [Zootermopsis nevadensis]|uniref:Uncharacterized protein n=1 Tax=Zootermopsis nevadensis TaxID=136037 RepID=A0A067QS55_ZOONE|nr:hypothetical protein L798_05784 [Zootermopsis nevadensis]